MSVFLQPIYTQTVGAGGAASVTFNNIPQGFTDLKVVVSLRSTATGSLAGGTMADSWGLYLNGAGGTNNSGTFGYGNVGTVTTTRFTQGFIYLGPINGAGSTANSFTSMEIYITNYNAGNYKPVIIDSSTATSSTTNYFLNLLSYLYRNNNPITSLRIQGGEGNFAEGSMVSLYGVSNAYDTAIPSAPTISSVTDLAGVASIAFTPTDSGRADSYSAFDPAIMSAPVYVDSSPIPVPVATNATYNLTSSANNSLGSGSTTPNSIISYNNYAAIATTTLTNSTTSSVVFSNLPQYYQHFQLRILARNTASGIGNAYITFNNDGTNRYSFHFVYSNGSSPFASNVVNGTGMWVLDAPGTATTANVWGSSITDILDYNNTTKFKTIRTQSGYDANGSGIAALYSGVWNSFEPVAQIGVLLPGGNFVSGTQIALYGIG